MPEPEMVKRKPLTQAYCRIKLILRKGEGATPRNSTMKIMYVEDNPANISLLQRIARMGGHQVINYTNGETALNNFEQDHPDLVLMDLQLEGRVRGWMWSSSFASAASKRRLSP